VRLFDGREMPARRSLGATLGDQPTV